MPLTNLLLFILMLEAGLMISLIIIYGSSFVKQFHEILSAIQQLHRETK